MTQPNSDVLGTLAHEFLVKLSEICDHNFFDMSVALERVISVYVYEGVAHDREELFMDIFSRHVVNAVQLLRQDDAEKAEV